jgi:hypothetical protein
MMNWEGGRGRERKGEKFTCPFQTCLCVDSRNTERCNAYITKVRVLSFNETLSA